MSLALAARAAGVASGDNDIDLEPDRIGGDCGQPLVLSFRPAILDRDVLTLDLTSFVQSLKECGRPFAPA